MNTVKRLTTYTSTTRRSEKKNKQLFRLSRSVSIFPRNQHQTFKIKNIPRVSKGGTGRERLFEGGFAARRGGGARLLSS